MNKKFLSLILALALSASLTACGSSGTTETTLSPKATATRAQVATILMRYTAE